MENAEIDVIVKEWLSKTYKNIKLPQGSMELHFFIVDVEFEFTRWVAELDLTKKSELRKMGVISESDRVTIKGRMYLMKLLK